MDDLSNYLKRVLEQILESYRSLLAIGDKPGDLETMNKEVAKINGSLRVILTKLESSDNNSDVFVTLQSLISRYVENYDFTREIRIMGSLYSEDVARLKNLRFTIISSLEDKHFIEKIDSIKNNI